MNFDEWWHKQMPNLVSGEEATDRAIAFAAWEAATAAERERCAKVCESFGGNGPSYIDDDWARMCAAAIRDS